MRCSARPFSENALKRLKRLSTSTKLKGKGTCCSKSTRRKNLLRFLARERRGEAKAREMIEAIRASAVVQVIARAPIACATVAEQRLTAKGDDMNTSTKSTALMSTLEVKAIVIMRSSQLTENGPARANRKRSCSLSKNLSS